MQAGDASNDAQIGHRHMSQIGRRHVIAALHHGAGILMVAVCVVVASRSAKIVIPFGHGAKCAVQRRWHPEGQKDDGYDLIQQAHG